jgi:acyl-CoA thioesterase
MASHRDNLTRGPGARNLMSNQDTGFIPLIGLETTGRGEGTSENQLQVREIHLNPHGVMHGAVLYAMADTGMGAALYTRLDAAESCATIEVKMVYLAPVTEGRLVCDTRLVHRSRRVATLESEVRNVQSDGSERLVGKALRTFAIFERRT